MVDKSLIRAENVAKYYAEGDVQALQGITLGIDRGEFISIMGPSGSGKSTLLHLLGALDTPTEGTIYFEGRPLARSLRHGLFRIRNFGFVFQAFFLWPHLNVFENISLPLVEISLRRREKAARVKAIIAEVGLSDKIHAAVGALSMGQRQRVAIARALVTHPQVLFADEPTGNLDSQNARQILGLFKTINKDRGTTVVMVTHEKIAQEYAHRTIRIMDGRIV